MGRRPLLRSLDISSALSLSPSHFRTIKHIENNAFPQTERIADQLKQFINQSNQNKLLLATLTQHNKTQSHHHHNLGNTQTQSLEHDNLVGFLLFSKIDANTALINKIAVETHSRRCGIGTAMLKRAIHDLQTSRRQRAKQMQVMLHVDPARYGARRMYAQMGFRECEQLSGYYPPEPGEEDAAPRDAIVMRYSIDSSLPTQYDFLTSGTNVSAGDVYLRA